MPDTDIDKAFTSEDYRVRIKVGTGTMIEGVLADDVSFAGQALWHSEDSNVGNQVGSAAIGAQKAVSQFGPEDGISLGGFDIGRGYSQKVLSTFVGATVAYIGTSPFMFTIPMIYLQYAKGITSLNVLGDLMSLVQPTFLKQGAINVLEAPHKFGLGKNYEVTNGVSIQIGKWFKTLPIFVVDSVLPTLSRQIMNDGTPLYNLVQVSVRSSRVLSAQEVRDMFVIPKAEPTK